MTGEKESIARAIYERRNGHGCKPWSLLTKAHKEPYLGDAEAAQALFAPILAEKERLAAVADHAARHWQQTQSAFQACLDATGSKDGAELIDKATRALAAEAALAGLRQNIVDAAVQCDDARKAQARLDRLAAAIRAEGE